MQATLAGRCGVVTDATSSIGRAVALELARDGARVAIGYHGYRGADFAAAERLVREVASVGGEAVPVRLPVDSLWELEQVVGRLVEHWGRLDFVVDLDCRCAFGRAALPWMLERGRGRIVHISASGGGSGQVRCTRSDLRALAARGVAINRIQLDSPRPASQPAVQAERAPEAGPSVETLPRPAPWAEPQAIAGTVYFLLAQDCCLTGQVIDLSGLDGGRHRRAGRRQRVPVRLQRGGCCLRWRRPRDSFRPMP